MLKIHDLKPAKGSKHKKKIVGRGHGSGHGQQATRGHKGHKARSGFHRVGGFEGGQMPLIRRIPKRGFNNPEKITVKEINIGLINKKFNEGEIVSPATLIEKGIIKKQNCIVKILGEGKLEKPLEIHAHTFSRKARQLIEKAKGKVIILKK